MRKFIYGFVLASVLVGTTSVFAQPFSAQIQIALRGFLGTAQTWTGVQTFTTPVLGAATATTLDTGQGAYELYSMDQNVLTTSSPTFANVATTTTKVAATTVGALGTCDSGARGTIKTVTDALLPVALATVGAGGAVYVPVICNGSAWIVF